MSTPTHIYKIVSSSALPVPLPKALPVSELDQNDGFIHLSTEKQLPGTLRRFFKNDSLVYILRINYRKVEKNIKWENGKGTGAAFVRLDALDLHIFCQAPGGIGEEGIFPHLYNGLRVGKEEIESFKQWEKDSQDSWDTAIDKARADGWFVY
ncbi:hypothetical protein NLJ89_g169 [Agrocybe chaxingu]|uniref:DUF952 domain protein n=1 Tax=Agrocybe chaxingu TaxID=84603 RepID=A0A9W8N2F4_9AGAR|nr:hypothetical protein NLJ89_g169 [Agrocybe chaxingu]